MKQNLPRASNQSCSDVRLQIGHQPQETAAGTENRSDRTLGGVATVFHSATPPIHSRSAHSTSKKTGACIMRAPLDSSATAANHTSPEMPPAAATASCQGFWRLGQPPSRPTFRPAIAPATAKVDFPRLMPQIANPRQYRKQEMASQPFRRGFVSSTTCNTPTGRDCLAATPPRFARGSHHARARLLIRPHSQSRAFSCRRVPVRRRSLRRRGRPPRLDNTKAPTRP
jgi:hypothetical protein